MRQASDRKTSLLFALPAALLALLCVDCAVNDREWTPYSVPDKPGHLIPSDKGVSVWTPTQSINLADLESHVNNGCISCHDDSLDPHHSSRSDQLEAACVDCHGGHMDVVWDGNEATKAATTARAHPEARYPEEWPSAANPERTYTLLNVESPEWIKFVNPGDLRVASETCGPCHEEDVLAVSKGLMATSAHFWGAAGYCNGIVSNKRSIFGESYSREGVAQKVNSLVKEVDADGNVDWRFPTAEESAEHSISPFVVPLPHWEVTQSGNVFRIFERGSRLGTTALGFNGLPVPVIGLPDKLEDPGRPNNRTSDRGLGTLNRVDLPLLNVHKTRLNDPHLGFLGTNDQPGDYRSSGCTACHMVYANDRDPVHSGPYAVHGNMGRAGETADQTIDTGESGHPIAHAFTNGIPSSQCMVCHMHQPNSFVNTYYGFQMWAYETDGAPMWPEEQQYPSHSEWFDRIDRNPEGAAVRGKWGDPEFLANVSDLNPQLEHTQFADYHGHGWIFRGVFKTDRKGNLLDKDGDVIDYADSSKFEGSLPPLSVLPELNSADPLVNGDTLRAYFGPKDGKAVHLKDIHAEAGLHCVDCHFKQDVHNTGMIYSEYQAAVQITCQDCHGTPDLAIDEFWGGDEKDEVKRTGGFAPLVKGGPAAKGPMSVPHRLPEGETPFGEPRFERRPDGLIIQRSMLYENVAWEVGQISNADRVSGERNERADYAHYQAMSDGSWAHGPEKMDCASCHTSWVTSCFGCHLPQKANWRSDVHHFEHKTLRNLASYNPQVARDDVFMLGISGDVKDNKVAVVRSSSAVIVSSEDSLRRIVYRQQPPVAANGMSSQVFNTHFAHTVRTTETRTCTDCHLSEDGDNNAWLAQVTLMGTGYVNFMGQFAWVGEGSSGFEAVKVTEWEEPQALIGSNLHRLSTPDDHAEHVANGRMLKSAEHHGGTDIRSLTVRGEYLYTASGEGGFRVYDIANIANKDFSEKLVTAPVSPLGQDTHVSSKYATAVALPTNNSISMARVYRPENREQEYEYEGETQNLHELYRYAYITDRYEGLIVVDIDSLTDGDPANNFLDRALTWNPAGLLDGAENIWIAGETALICCKQGLVAVSIADPMKPVAMVALPMSGASSVTVQFRHAFVTDSEGLKVVDMTGLMAPEGALDEEGVAYSDRPLRVVGSLRIEDARHVYVARTWAFVSAGAAGMVIVDVEKPDEPSIDQTYNAEGRLKDLHMVQVASVNDSTYAFLADGDSGLHVVSLVTPEDGGRSAYGYAPRPKPTWIAGYRTHGPAIALARGLDRDRAVDESGNQMTVFGRIGGRPFNRQELQDFFFHRNDKGQLVPHRVPADGNPPADWTRPEPSPPSGDVN